MRLKSPCSQFPIHFHEVAFLPPSPFPPHAVAMHSISTFTPLGSCLTATQLRAGRVKKCRSYSALNSAKSAMSVRKALTLTTRSSAEPAAARMALRLAMQVRVRRATPPSTTSPEGSAGIWPETKIRLPTTLAWDCEGRSGGLVRSVAGTGRPKHGGAGRGGKVGRGQSGGGEDRAGPDGPTRGREGQGRAGNGAHRARQL